MGIIIRAILLGKVVGNMVRHTFKIVESREVLARFGVVLPVVHTRKCLFGLGTDEVSKPIVLDKGVRHDS